VDFEWIFEVFEVFLGVFDVFYGVFVVFSVIFRRSWLNFGILLRF
jgi:hypothetical protein